jgi:hypothetical protein
MTKTITRETFRVPTVETLLKLKLFVYTQRKLSAKGQKDRLDILSLVLASPINPKNVPKELAQIIRETINIPELGINEHIWSKRKKELLKG